MRALALLFLFPLLVLSACAAAAPAPAGPATVTVDVFSGRPSPTWTMTPAEMAEFERRLAALPATGPVSLFDGLGYRGFVVGWDSSRRTVTVQNGAVEVEQNGDKKFFRDPDHGLEKWLLASGQLHLDPALYTFLEQGIGR